MRKILAIDFDGTIVRHIFPLIGKLLPNAIDSLQKLKNAGFILILWTCRAGKQLEDAKSFCKQKKIPIDYYNENAKEINSWNLKSNKIYADFYIDDKGIFCNEINWEQITKYLLSII